MWACLVWVGLALVSRADDPDGVNLLERGQPCGTDAGECVAGLVTGCDLSQTTAGAMNPHFVCNGAFVGPQTDLRNGVDETCENGLTDDGLDECTAQAPDCCGALGLCVDLQTSLDHCGQCGWTCDPLRADRCVAGSCRCGDGAPCGSNQTCQQLGSNIKCH